MSTSSSRAGPAPSSSLKRTRSSTSTSATTPSLPWAPPRAALKSADTTEMKATKPRTSAESETAEGEWSEEAEEALKKALIPSLDWNALLGTDNFPPTLGAAAAASQSREPKDAAGNEGVKKRETEQAM
ncbi:hypothetical protein JCM8547_008926 [Rhodosporidiobolus lusitaniae]